MPAGRAGRALGRRRASSRLPRDAGQRAAVLPTSCSPSCRPMPWPSRRPGTECWRCQLVAAVASLRRHLPGLPARSVRRSADAAKPGRRARGSALGRFWLGGLGLRLAVRHAVRPALRVLARRQPRRRRSTASTGGIAAAEPGAAPPAEPDPDRPAALVRRGHRARRGYRDRDRGVRMIARSGCILIPSSAGVLAWLAGRWSHARPRWISLAAPGHRPRPDRWLCGCSTAGSVGRRARTAGWPRLNLALDPAARHQLPPGARRPQPAAGRC